MRLFWIKNRHIITAAIGFCILAVIVILGIRLQNVKKGVSKAKTYTASAMGTVLHKSLYAENQLLCDQLDQQIDQYIDDLDKQLSVRIMDSEVSICNHSYAVGGCYPLSVELQSYLEQELEISKETGGAFSPCIRPLSGLWGIEEGYTEIPSEESIVASLNYVDASNIEIRDGGIVFNKENMAIDFGAIGKGIACDGVLSILSDAGMQGGVVAVGGSIVTYGYRESDKEWHIGIQDPRGKDGNSFAVLDLTGNNMISTSGDYEKYFEQNGKRYHHILDPRTGYPVDNGVISVTAVAQTGLLSDAMSTACFVLGVEKGLAYAEEKGVELVMVTADQKVYATKGIRKKLRITNKSYKLQK